MNYQAFYNEIVHWIHQVNMMAMKHSMDNQEFWEWVSRSIGEIGNKYQNNTLVKMQMAMLFQWLEEVYENGKGNAK